MLMEFFYQRAVLATSGLFDLIMTCDDIFSDGAITMYNPINEVWAEAKNLWFEEKRPLESQIQCIVLIGTGILIDDLVLVL